MKAVVAANLGRVFGAQGQVLHALDAILDAQNPSATVDRQAKPADTHPIQAGAADDIRNQHHKQGPRDDGDGHPQHMDQRADKSHVGVVVKGRRELDSEPSK